MFLPVESYIDMDFIYLKHGVLLEAFVNAMTCGAEPDGVDLGIDVTQFKSFFKIAQPESEVLESQISLLE